MSLYSSPSRKIRKYLVLLQEPAEVVGGQIHDGAICILFAQQAYLNRAFRSIDRLNGERLEQL